jgi:hypothetical protein
MDSPGHDDFVNAVTQILAQRPKSNIMVLIETEKGLEIYQSLPSPLWAYGVLRAADEVVTAQHRANLDHELIQRRQEQTEMEFQAAVDAAKGNVN